MRKYVKKPVIVEAMVWDGTNFNDIWDWAGTDNIYSPTENNPDSLLIYTLEGPMTVSLGDAIIKGVKGEFYPCKPDIFAMTYDACDDD